jgi:hypothetical protein
MGTGQAADAAERHAWSGWPRWWRRCPPKWARWLIPREAAEALSTDRRVTCWIEEIPAAALIAIRCRTPSIVPLFAIYAFGPKILSPDAVSPLPRSFLWPSNRSPVWGMADCVALRSSRYVLGTGRA